MTLMGDIFPFVFHLIRLIKSAEFFLLDSGRIVVNQFHFNHRKTTSQLSKSGSFIAVSMINSSMAETWNLKNLANPKFVIRTTVDSRESTVS